MLRSSSLGTYFYKGTNSFPIKSAELISRFFKLYPSSQSLTSETFFFLVCLFAFVLSAGSYSVTKLVLTLRECSLVTNPSAWLGREVALL